MGGTVIFFDDRMDLLLLRKICRGLGRFSLSQSSILSTFLWKESRHDRNIADWDFKPLLNQPIKIIVLFEGSSICFGC